MNRNRVVHVILAALGLLTLCLVAAWLSRRPAPLAAAPGVPATVPPEGAPTGLRTPRPHDRATARPPLRPAEESPEHKARIARVVALERELALIQEDALNGVAEADQADVLSALADTRQQTIAEAAAAREALRPPAGTELPALAGAEAVRIRFEAVRQSLIEDGLSLEEAELRLQSARPEP